MSALDKFIGYDPGQGTSYPGASNVGGGMEPLTTAALLSSATSVLGAALSPAPAAPSGSSIFSPNTFDHSGWTVATGKGKAQASAGFKFSPWLIGGLAILGTFAWIKTQKR